MSFFPDINKQGDIKFIFCKTLPYMVRIKLIAFIFVVGLCTQLLINYWFGLILLVIGTSLGLIKGYAEKNIYTDKEKWRQVTPDEYRKVRVKQKELKRWDIDCFDITNPLGLFVFASVSIFFIYFWIHLMGEGNVALASYLAGDAVFILAPHWLVGVRSYLRKDRLIVKIGLLTKVIKYLSNPSDIQVLPMLSTRETEDKGREPIDARLLVKAVNASDEFLGLQIQISVNNVQGHDYPYLYCVLIAKDDANYFRNYGTLVNKYSRNIVYEKTKAEDVDVLVIRQRTTRTSGYHTNFMASKRVVQAALDLMRELIKEK